MSLSEFLLGPGDFKNAAQVIGVARRASSPLDGEDFDHAQATPIFKTSKQQTWLVATNKRLFCVLDDLPRSFTRVQWAMPSDEIVAPNGKLLTKIRARSDTANTGQLDIGSKRGWLFSKRLFQGTSVEESVADLVRSQMALSK